MLFILYGDVSSGCVNFTVVHCCYNCKPFLDLIFFLTTKLVQTQCSFPCLQLNRQGFLDCDSFFLFSCSSKTFFFCCGCSHVRYVSASTRFITWCIAVLSFVGATWILDRYERFNCITPLIFFCSFMQLLWKNIERHGLHGETVGQILIVVFLFLKLVLLQLLCEGKVVYIQWSYISSSVSHCLKNVSFTCFLVN